MSQGKTDPRTSVLKAFHCANDENLKSSVSKRGRGGLDQDCFQDFRAQKEKIVIPDRPPGTEKPGLKL